jgi:hypothetical protein
MNVAAEAEAEAESVRAALPISEITDMEEKLAN